MDVSFKGCVQGVGFRYTAVSIAVIRRISGFVRNEPDGSVALSAEGEREDLLAFLSDLQSSHVSRYIDHLNVSWREAGGTFRGFVIAR